MDKDTTGEKAHIFSVQIPTDKELPGHVDESVFESVFGRRD